MPPAVPSRTSFTFQPWLSPKQSRHSSTRQVLNSVHNDERMAAILHSKKINGGEKVASKSSSLDHAPSHPSPHPSAIPSRHNAQQSAQSQPSRKKGKKKHRWEVRGRTGNRGNAAASQSQPSAKRQRSDALGLRDEYYVRRTMRIPTPQEYPNAPTDFLKNPKASILNVAHGSHLATCRSEFVSLAYDACQCTAYYESAMHNEAVIGEGRTQASRSV